MAENHKFSLLPIDEDGKWQLTFNGMSFTVEGIADDDLATAHEVIATVLSGPKVEFDPYCAVRLPQVGLKTCVWVVPAHVNVVVEKEPDPMYPEGTCLVKCRFHAVVEVPLTAEHTLAKLGMI